jgi:outer membrane protein insertion porin family
VLGFTEGGYTWATRNDFNPFNVAKSAGIGAKIFLPMFGLVSLDYGWPIDPSMQRQGDPGKGNFHFTLGANIGDL